MFNSDLGDVMLDEALLNEYFDSLGSDIVEQMLALYKEQVVGYLAEISLAGEAQDSMRWQQACHKMKGAAGSVGLISLNKALASAEHDETDYAVQHKALAELNSQSLNSFDQWLASKG